MQQDIYNLKRPLESSNEKLTYFSLPELQKQGHSIEKMPFSIRILLENALRNYDDFSVTKDHLESILNWKPAKSDKDVAFKPARVLMQDFTGVPLLVDLAAMRSTAERLISDNGLPSDRPGKINFVV